VVLLIPGWTLAALRPGLGRLQDARSNSATQRSVEVGVEAADRRALDVEEEDPVRDHLAGLRPPHDHAGTAVGPGRLHRDLADVAAFAEVAEEAADRIRPEQSR
jgi:hypothetical protein